MEEKSPVEFDFESQAACQDLAEVARTLHLNPYMATLKEKSSGKIFYRLRFWASPRQLDEFAKAAKETLQKHFPHAWNL